jgi:hypothetical protein
MCAEASTIMRAVAADFIFNCCYLEIRSDNRIRLIARCVQYHAQGFRLETFKTGLFRMGLEIRDEGHVNTAMNPRIP